MLNCPHCQSTDVKVKSIYETVHNDSRQLFHCNTCGHSFSETSQTAMFGVKSPISKVASVMKIRSEGMSLRATARVLGVHKNTVSRWETLFANYKSTLMLYVFCHQFIKLSFEGDELYTVVNKRGKAIDSKDWTIVLLERSTRFLLEQTCGEKDKKLFELVISKLVKLIENGADITLLSDGERRYGNVLFELCQEVLQTGKTGRPKKVLKKGVKVRIKNKGSRKNTKGRKPKKYQAPKPEHPDTVQDIEEQEIHANHLEAQNAACRRRNSAFRRRTNTYAKNKDGLQRTLDVHLIIHNFVRPHFTTKQVPAVDLGVLEKGVSLQEILQMRQNVA